MKGYKMANKKTKQDAPSVKALKALVGDNTPAETKKPNRIKQLCGLAIVAMIVAIFYSAVYSYFVDHLKDVATYTPIGVSAVTVLAFTGGAYYFLKCEE